MLVYSATYVEQCVRVQRADVLATLTALSVASNPELVSGLRQAGTLPLCYNMTCCGFLLRSRQRTRGFSSRKG